MYLRKVHIENIRSIAELDWNIPEGREAGWHVIIGDNGSGKSTLLRAISLVLIGQIGANALQPNLAVWLRNGELQGLIQVGLRFNPRVDQPAFSMRFGDQIVHFLQRGLQARSAFGGLSPMSDALKMEVEKTDDHLTGKGDLLLSMEVRRENGVVSQFSSSEQVVLFDYLTTENRGCFSAAYGPFRRFTGSDRETERKLSANPRLAAHLSIFGENFALTECLEWLHELDYRQAKKKTEDNLLNRLRNFINQEGFLPHQAKLTEISPDSVIFSDGDGLQISVEELSDGYRSILSMTFDLVRQMSRIYKLEQIFSDDSSKIIAPGVVLIDEVDAHLHPTWQRRIGLWFREHFPNIQFIVTTHSPLVCQAAEVGTVFRLPEPGSDEQAGMVTGIALNRLLYGDVIEAYGTQLFGDDVGRSDAGLKKLERLAQLNVKEVNSGLSKAERTEQESLRAAMPTAIYTPETVITNGRRKGKRK